MNKMTKQRFQNEISFSLFDGMGWEKIRRNEGDLISLPIFQPISNVVCKIISI